jgi:ABC-type taurine transport system ATPase subunit
LAEGDVVGLVLEGVPASDVPAVIRVPVGEQRAAVVTDPDDARLVADLAAGLVERPPGTVVDCDGRVLLVPAEGGLLPYLTVLGNVMHGCRVARRVSRREAEDEARATAGWCGLEDVLDRFPHEITPGRQRLAGVARALVARPAAIVLEDAAGLPTWGALLDLAGNPELLSTSLLLITPDRDRALGFGEAGDG